jgi:hypothetical protein
METNNIVDNTVTISSTEINNLNTNFSNTVNSDKKHKIYTKNEKKIIFSRLEQIKHKKINLKIFKIIEEGGDHHVLNETGVFLNLNNLSDSTLTKIEHFLDMFDNLKKNNNKPNSTWNNLLQKTYDSCENENTDSTSFSEKLNNHEKMFIKKQQMLNDKETVLWGSNICQNNNL